MSPSEIGFLALGLCVGIAAGVLLAALARPRSPLRPVVKVTVTPNAMAPRDRIATGPGRPARSTGPLRGSPDDDAAGDWAAAVATSASGGPASGPVAATTRTLVPSGAATGRPVGIPIVAGDRLPDLGGTARASAVADRPRLAADGAVRAAADPALAVAVAERPADVRVDRQHPAPSRIDIRPGRATAAELAVRPRPPVRDPRPALAADLVAVPIVGRAAKGRDGAEGRGRTAPGHTLGDAPDACADERAESSVACAEADLAREGARALADRLREAQRAHADLQARVEEAGSIADPRHLAAEKERLHTAFQAAHAASRSTEDAEAAARDWLSAVSNANTAARDAVRRVQAGTDELRVQAAALERLDLEANAARIAAERAEDACRAARESLAACEERQHVPGGAGDAPDARDTAWPTTPEPGYDPHPGPSNADRLPVILRVLAGDAAAREQLVASLAGGDPDARSAWHVRIARFVDAVVARAIEDGFLEVSEDHAFWRVFSADEQLEIVQALSALGFRFDGMRGFVDERVPSARDLSLAVGYAGLDRMRIRAWPGESALAALYEDAVVRADLWLAQQADDLSLARVEAALGPRAAGLGEVWDAWGRVRPAMLEER